MRATGLILVLAVGLAACGSDAGPDDGAEPARTAERTETAPERAKLKPKPFGTTIKVADSQFGPILFDRRGQAIYVFDKEKSERPDCYGACAEAWPPVLTRGKPRPGAGIRRRLLGTTKRRDGRTQVTYAGRPLYFYAHEGVNEVTCHNVAEFGGLWLVLNAAGRVPS